MMNSENSNSMHKLVVQLKHAANELANLSACAAAKRGSHWRKHRDAISNRENSKKKFISILMNLKISE